MYMILERRAIQGAKLEKKEKKTSALQGNILPATASVIVAHGL